MAVRNLSSKIYDMARRRALEDLTEAYPELYRYFCEQRMAEFNDPDHYMHAKFNGKTGDINDQARRRAAVDLRNVREGAWQVLLPLWSQHYKDEYGWVDERPAANAARGPSAVRGSDGKFVRTGQ